MRPYQPTKGDSLVCKIPFTKNCIYLEGSKSSLKLEKEMPSTVALSVSFKSIVESTMEDIMKMKTPYPYRLYILSSKKLNP